VKKITQLIPTRLLSCILLNYERVALFSRVSLRVVSSQLSSRRLPYVFFHPTQGPIERQDYEKGRRTLLILVDYYWRTHQNVESKTYRVVEVLIILFPSSREQYNSKNNVQNCQNRLSSIFQLFYIKT